MSTPPRPVRDLDSAAYWDGLTRHELLVQQCSNCDALQFPFRPACVKCTAFGVEPVAVSGRATVLSWITTHRVFHPSFADRVPYTTVLVRLEEGAGLLMYGLWSDAEPPAGEGAAAHARFVDHDDFTLVEWEPAS